MAIVRVLNNNVVLATREDGREVIHTGWGVGFQKKPGHEVDPEKITRTFVPEEGGDSDHAARMLAALDPEFILLADRALLEVAALPGAPGSPVAQSPATPHTATVIALADHLAFAVRRSREQAEGQAPEHPLKAEVTHLYPAEYAAALRIVDMVNDARQVQLPAAEAVAVALHLVNAGFRTEDLSDTYTMTGVFSQLFAIIDAALAVEVDRSSLSAARFVTHLRYFFVRAREGRQLQEGMTVLAESLTATHPEAVICARRLAKVLELRLEVSVTEDEIAYLALHVARLHADLES